MIHIRKDLQDQSAAYTRPPEAKGPAYIRAHMNEMTGDWPAAQKGQFLRALETVNLGLYPETQASLTARIETQMGAPSGSVLLGPSSGALLDLLALAGLNPGDSVAIPDPGFSLYPLLVKRAHGVLVRVPVGTELPLGGFREAALAGARQLWITSPNNPTGAHVEPEVLEALCEELATQARPPLVVLDEAYVEFASATGRLLCDRFPFVVLLRTLSKALGSAGLRLGYLIGDPTLVQHLAALQLPYSIAAPSLCALELALATPEPFERLVKETIERRDRLAQALQPKARLARSAANFLHITPERTSDLLAKGVLARALPGTPSLRVSLSDERTAVAIANVYEATLPPPQKLPARALLVLDVDGVLIEAEASFRTAVARALAELQPSLPWNDSLFRTMKRVSGMNNDFRLAAALLHLWLQRTEDGGARFTALCNGTAPVLTETERRAIADAEAEVAACVAQHYAQTQAMEQPLITATALTAIWDTCAIYTGRNADEFTLATRTLGFSFPAVVDRGAHVRKPAPGGLLQLRDRFRADAIMFVGDTRDDLGALLAARSALPHVRFAFCAVGPARHEIVTAPDNETMFSFVDLPTGAAALRAWLLRESL
jgi:histidinol-phosphate aminotransferase